MTPDNTFLERLAENIGLFGGKHCEVVVHDFRESSDATISKIVNGHVTGRTVGGPPTNLFFETATVTNGGRCEDIPLYYSRLPNGSIIKSCSTFIHDENGKVIGAVCINLDVSKDVTKVSDQESAAAQTEPQRNELYAKDITEILLHYVQLSEAQVGKPVAEMNRADKIQALKFLDDHGIFQISKAGVYLCEHFHISKFTLYNYLNTIREERDSQ